MQQLRLLADDLTGALDTSAEFVGALGPLDVAWRADAITGRHGSFAIDSGTRELGAERAFAIARELAPLLRGAGIAYKKIDSLMRGPWAAELNACLHSGFWDACIVAPAFRHQGRCTRAGRQFAKGGRELSAGRREHSRSASRPRHRGSAGVRRRSASPWCRR
jgi:D-threonate/D-erythronate kinase